MKEIITNILLLSLISRWLYQVINMFWSWWLRLTEGKWVI